MDSYWKPASQPKPRTRGEPEQDDAQHGELSQKELLVCISLEEVQTPAYVNSLHNLNGNSPAYLQESKQACHPRYQP